MQYALTCTATAVLFASFAFVAVSFLSYAWNRTSATAPLAPPAPLPAPEIEVDAELEEAWQRFWESPLPVVAVEPDPWETELPPCSPLPLIPPTPHLLLLPPAAPEVAEPPLPDTIRELRKLCKERGLKGAGRWTKAQCLTALAA